MPTAGPSAAAMRGLSHSTRAFRNSKPVQNGAALACRQEVHNVVAGAKDAGLAEDDRYGDVIVRIRGVKCLGHCGVHFACQRIFLLQAD